VITLYLVLIPFSNAPSGLGLWPLSVLSLSSTMAKAVTAEVQHFNVLYISEERAHGATTSVSIHDLGEYLPVATEILARVFTTLSPPALEGAPSSSSLQPGHGRGSRPAGADMVSSPPWLVDPDLGLSIFSVLLPAQLGMADAISKFPNSLCIVPMVCLQLVKLAVRQIPSPLQHEMVLICIRSQCFASMKAWACTTNQSGAALLSGDHDIIIDLWSLMPSVTSLNPETLRLLLEDMARSDVVPMLARMEDEAHQKAAQQLRMRVGGSKVKNMFIPNGCIPELAEILMDLTVPDFKPWTIVWGKVWMITDLVQRMSAQMCGTKDMAPLKESTNCVLDQQPPMQNIIGYFIQSSSVDVPSTPFKLQVAYDDRPCSCSQCVLLTAPAMKARRRLLVYVVEPYFKAFRPNVAAIAAAWEQVTSNLAGGNSSATTSSQPSHDKPAAPFPPLPVGCWNPGCSNML
jgi:hypothetical protein